MNETLRGLFRAYLEARTALQALADDAADTEVRAAEAAVTEAQNALQEGLAEPEPEQEPEIRSLIERTPLAGYLTPYARGVRLEGEARELNQALHLDDVSQIPWEAIMASEAEIRQDAATTVAAGSININTMPILSRVFHRTEAAFLGVTMPMVAPGQAYYPVLTGGTDYGMHGPGSAQAATAATFEVEAVKPTRATARYLYQIEGEAELGGELEAVLSADLRMVMGQAFDVQAIAGDGTGANVKGIQTSLGDRPADPGKVATAEDYRSAIIDAVDFTYTGSENEVRMLVADQVWKHARRTYQDTENTIDSVTAMQNLGASLRRSGRITGNKAKVGYGIRTSQPMAAIMPVWQGVTAIRDPYSDAASGQVSLTMHALFGFVMRRLGGWGWHAFKTAA